MNRMWQEESGADLARRYQLLGRWLTVLFWLVVPNLLAGGMSDEQVLTLFPALRVPGMVLNFLCLLAYGGILLGLGSQCGHYRVAGACCLAAGVIQMLLALLPGGAELDGGLSALNAVAVVLSVVSAYQECIGHSEVLTGVDGVLAGQWRKLWWWNVAALAAILGSSIFFVLFVSMLGMMLGVMIVLAASVGALVVSVLKLVYLYRTASRFRIRGQQLAGEERGM